MGTTQSNNLAQTPDNTPIADKNTGRVNFIWNQWFTNVQIKLNTITAAIIALSKNATAGFLSSDGSGGIFARTLTPGTGIIITHGDGVAGNPIISASASGGSPINIVNNAATSYTVQLTDLPNTSSNVGWVVSSVGTANNIQIDTHANQALPIGAHLYVSEEGSGQTTIKALSGVTFVGSSITAVTKGVGEAVQIATDTWHIFGNLSYQIYATYTSVVLADSPVAYWHLGEASGTSAADSSGNSYTGTYTGTYSQGQTSILPSGFGASLQLSGAGYVLTPSTSGLAGISAPVSLEAWVYFTTIPTSNEVIIAISQQGPQLAISSTTSGRVTFGYSGIVNGTESSGSVSVNTKTHLVVTVTSGGAIIYYINGVSAGTGTVTVYTGSGNGHIGVYGLGGYNLSGSVQEVAVYNTVLSATRVAAHYAAG